MFDRLAFNLFSCKKRWELFTFWSYEVPDQCLMASFRIVSVCWLNWNTCSRQICSGGGSRCRRCLLRSSSLSIRDRKWGKTSRGRWSSPLRTCTLERGVRTLHRVFCSKYGFSVFIHVLKTGETKLARNGHWSCSEASLNFVNCYRG